jgi:hypothetical protein
VEENVGAMGLRLTGEDLGKIENALESLAKEE